MHHSFTANYSRESGYGENQAASELIVPQSLQKNEITRVFSFMTCIMHVQRSYLSRVKKTAINHLGSTGFMMSEEVKVLDLNDS